MRIDRLTLENFRGARELSLELHPRLNVFVGTNGAGKSTVLDAAAILLSWLANRIKYASGSGRPVDEKDITNDRSTASIHLKGGFADEQIEWQGEWSITKTRSGHVSDKGRSLLSELNELARHLQEQITETNERTNLPLIAYYPVNRAVQQISLRIGKKPRFNLLAAYEEALTSGANFRSFFEWFREREDLENESGKYIIGFFKPDDFQFPDPQLEAVRAALSIFMPDFENLSVRRNPLRMEVTKRGKRLTVDQLSDGEKCLMAMVGDLARRLAIANPERANPLQGQGVVLIDEIDLHLHPKWQRMVVSRLMDVFPGCQFLVSTHSPHVMTHVRPEHLYLLEMTDENILAERPSESYGKSVERILEDLMGLETTRPDPVNRALQRIYAQIDQGQLDLARKRIDELKGEIGEDPELVKAAVLIKRKELVGR